MQAGTYNFVIEQGVLFRRVLMWRNPNNPDGTPGAPIDLTGYTGARMKIKDRVGGLILSLTLIANANGDVLTLGGTAGTVTIYISSATTTDMDFTDAVYDLELDDVSSETVRLLKGVVDLSTEVTN